MENLINETVLNEYIGSFLFIVLRMGILMAMMPLFTSKSFPVQYKIGFVIAFALLLTPVLKFDLQESNIPILVIKEVIFSLALALVVRFIFIGIDIAGQIISHEMHLSMATVFNPGIGQSTELARFLSIIAILFFFATDAHHDLIYMIVKSYDILPVGHVRMEGLFKEIIGISSKIFIIALKIAAPIMIGTLIMSLLLGFIYKAAPQINIFFVSMPIYLFVGFLILLFSFPVFFYVLGEFFGEIKSDMYRILAAGK